MSHVISKIPNNLGIYEYRRSVNTPDYFTTLWEVNPDVSGVAGVDEIYWKYVGSPSSIVEMSQDEKDAVDAAVANAEIAAEGQDGVVNTPFVVNFSYRRVARNRWLQYQGEPSNESPFVTPSNGNLVSASFRCNSNADTDIEIYVNASLTHTWEIRSDNKVTLSNFTESPVVVSEGDELSVLARDRGVNPKRVIVVFRFE